MSTSKRNTILTGVAIVVVVAGILVWHFVIGPWLDEHKTDDGASRAATSASRRA